MKHLSIAIASVVVFGVLAGCSNPTGTDTAPLSGAARDSAKETLGQKRAAQGGGLVPQPEVPKPGEHVGMPGAGAKATGG